MVGKRDVFSGDSLNREEATTVEDFLSWGCLCCRSAASDQGSETSPHTTQGYFRVHTRMNANQDLLLTPFEKAAIACVNRSECFS